MHETHTSENVNGVEDAVSPLVPEGEVMLSICDDEVIVHRMELGPMHVILMSLRPKINKPLVSVLVV